MGCSQKKKNESYDLFNNFEKYINAVEKIQSTDISDNEASDCKSFYATWNPGLISKEEAKSICVRFVCLYKSLTDNIDYHIAHPDYKNHWAVLNLWLNSKLREISNNGFMCVKEFYNNDMEHHISNTVSMDLSTELIYDINDDEFDKMYILYNLYSDYHKIYRENEIICEKKSICLDFSKKCVDEYKKGIIKCENKESEFCQAMEKFKSTYETLKQNSKIKNDFNSNDLISLSSYQEALNESLSELNRRNITIVTISIICSIFGIILILFYLYKFTPFGKWLPINKKRNQEKRHDMKEQMYNFIDNSNEYSTYNEYTPYRVGYNST